MEGAEAIWRLYQLPSVHFVAIMHVQESCVVWRLYHRLYVHSTQPDGVMCRLLPHFFKIVEIQQWKAKRARNGLECSLAAEASSMVSAVKDRQVSELVSANSKCIVT